MALTEKMLAVSKNSWWSCLGRIHGSRNWWDAVRVDTHLQPAQQLLEEVLGCRTSLSQRCLQGQHLLQTRVRGLLIFFMELHHAACNCTQVPLREHIAIGQVLVLPHNWKQILSSIGIVSPADIIIPLLPLLTRFWFSFIPCWICFCLAAFLVQVRGSAEGEKPTDLHPNVSALWACCVNLHENRHVPTLQLFLFCKMDIHPSTYRTEMCPELNNWSIHNRCSICARMDAISCLGGSDPEKGKRYLVGWGP